MTLWIIEPRDPLIFGDGKPFNAIPGSRAKSLPFPFPSTVAGCVRTRAGRDPASGRFDTNRIEELLAKAVRGPLLVEVADTESGMIVADWLLPAPADALLLKTDSASKGLRKWLRPLQLAADSATNLDGLAVVGQIAPHKQKPHREAPRYWRWHTYLQWLQAPRDGTVTLNSLGHNGPGQETRIHVSIEQTTQTAREGALFQTSGLEFVRTQQADGRAQLSGAQPLALAVDTDAELWEGPDFMGGERRVVRWCSSESVLPVCPDPVRRQILDRRACRLILVTPGYFMEGYLPNWVLQATHGVAVTVEGAAVRRYQTVSGWDYKEKAPKPTRRLAPAGSVYFVKLQGEDASIDRFIDAVWMQNISDDEQTRRDGFGLAILGTWDGVSQQMEVEP